MSDDDLRPEQMMIPLHVEVRDKLRQRGRYDAQTYKREHPEEYEMVVELLGKDYSMREIKTLIGCAYETIMAVALERQPDVRAGKRELVKSLRNILAYGADGLLEQAKQGKLSALEFAILVDKLQLLSGDVTERIGHVIEVDPDVAEFRKFSEAREVPGMLLGMGSGDEKLLEEGGLGGLDDLGGEEGAVIELSGDGIETNNEERDSESAGNDTQHAQPE